MNTCYGLKVYFCPDCSLMYCMDLEPEEGCEKKKGSWKKPKRSSTL